MKTCHSKYSFALAHSEVITQPYVYFHKPAYINQPRSVLKKDCISAVWLSQCGPTTRPWATAFSVARRNIQKKFKFEIGWKACEVTFVSWVACGG